MKLHQPAIFLDRDGVLNRAIVRNKKPYAPRALEEFEIFPEAPQIIKQFKQAGFFVIVVTNQPDVGNGLVAQSVVESMHALLNQRLLLDDIKVCYHRQDAGCPCRKPKPGMLLEAARVFSIDLTRSVIIGDRSGDIEAGFAAGCKTVFIDYQYAESLVREPDIIVSSLLEAGQAILSK